MAQVITTPADWTSALRGLAGQAHDGLCVVSPWVSRASVEALVDASPNGVRLLVRWPRDGSELPLVAGAQLRSLREMAKLELRYVDFSEQLHAKVYLCDASEALVGSANLTASGTGLGEGGSPNLEVGVLVDGDAAEELASWFHGRWEQSHPFSDAELALLEEWTAGGDEDPPPPHPPSSRKELALQAMRRLEARGVVEPGWKPQLGFDKAAFLVRMPGAKSDTVVRVHFSTPDKTKTEQTSFHFGFYGSDITYARKSPLRASRVVMVPLEEDGNHISNEAPILVIPLNSVFWHGKNRSPTQQLDPAFFPVRRVKGKRRYESMPAHLERSGRKWVLRVPTPSRRSKRQATIELKPEWVVS